MRPFVLLALLVASLPAQAAECEPSTKFPTFTVHANALGFDGYYVDVDNCLGVDCTTSVWVYEETNGIAGLQRGDEVWDDTCGGEIPADTQVF